MTFIEKEATRQNLEVGTVTSLLVRCNG